MTSIHVLTICQFYIIKVYPNALTSILTKGEFQLFVKKAILIILREYSECFSQAQGDACVHKVFRDDGELWMKMVDVPFASFMCEALPSKCIVYERLLSFFIIQGRLLVPTSVALTILNRIY